MSSTITQISSVKVHGGQQRVYSHSSKELKCDMKFGVFLPNSVTEGNKPAPVVFYLSGLTCTEENFIQKSGFQKYANEYGLIVVNPDTSPRNVNIPGEDESYDFGSGAGFYVDATEEPWKKNYRMFSYVTSELIDLVNENFLVVPNKIGIMGHSMGGHGALICALKNPGLYSSVSTFAAISNPINCPWGQKALKGYLGSDESEWKNWDATELVKVYNGIPMEIFLDQGNDDNFLKQSQLLPENLVKASTENDKIQAFLNMRDGYDHSYFYINTFIEEHIKYHAKFLKE